MTLNKIKEIRSFLCFNNNKTHSRCNNENGDRIHKLKHQLSIVELTIEHEET